MHVTLWIVQVTLSIVQVTLSIVQVTLSIVTLSPSIVQVTLSTVQVSKLRDLIGHLAVNYVRHVFERKKYSGIVSNSSTLS